MAFTAKITDLIAGDKTGLLMKHESWERVPLSDVASILNGAPFDSAMFNTTGGIPLARIRDVIAGRTSTYYTGEYEDAYLLSQGDLLVGMDGDFNTGYWGEQVALLNQRVCKLTPNSDFYDKALLGYVLPGYLAAINANTPSITVKHLSSKTIGEIELPLPPRAEQARIVEKLEELLSDLDAGVAELKAAQRKLAQYRQSLLKAAVEGALTADWRAAHGAPQGTGAELLQRILSERRARWEQRQLAKFAEQNKAPPRGWQAKYPEPVAPDIADLPALPEGWVWVSVDQVGEVQLGKMLDKAKHKEGESLPYLRNINVRWGAIDTSDLSTMNFKKDEIERFGLEAGDVLVCEGGEPGRAAMCGPAHASLKYQKALHRVRLFDTYVPDLLVCYLEYAAKSGLLDRSFTGSTIKHLTRESLIELPLPLPPLREQFALSSVLKREFVRISELRRSVETTLKQVAAQRKNILKAAFSGQLVSQDPNDEPASVLLARIRAERASNDGSAPRRRRKTA